MVTFVGFPIDGGTCPSNVIGYNSVATTAGDIFLAPQVLTVCSNAGTTAGATTTTGTVFFGGGGTGGNSNMICGGGGSATTVWVDTVITVEEEDYLNNLEYYEAARARGVRFQVRTADMRAREEEQRARERAAAEERDRERLAAEERARELLLSHLTEEQRQTVERHGWFVVVGGRTGKTYRVRTDKGYQHNILEMWGDRAVYDLCCHLSQNSRVIPKYDHFLAQKLCLEVDEDNFLRLANRRAA